MRCRQALVMRVSCLGLMLLLTACIETVVVGDAIQVPVDPQLSEQEDVTDRLQRKRIGQLRVILANAQQALAHDRLMQPKLDNAYYWYQQALAIDELNAESHWGMRQITARYIELAEQSFTDGRAGNAELMLERAGLISATPAQLEKIRQRYHQQNDERKFALSVADLRARNDKIKQHLAQLAVQAREGQSRLTIIARNDAEGRWIYQHMRSAVNGYRLRGNIQLGSKPQVFLIDL